MPCTGLGNWLFFSFFNCAGCLFPFFIFFYLSARELSTTAFRGCKL